MSSLKDVAKYAGVSTATVSRVINNLGNVKPETRRIVLKAVKELDFKPSKVAQRLRSKFGDRRLIGLIVPDIQNPFYVDVVRGVEDMVYANDYAVFMCNFAQNVSKAKLYLDIMKTEGVDGIILAPTKYTDESIQGLLSNNFPIVLIDRDVPSLDADMVVVDNVQGSFNAVSLLIEKGHKRIAYIGGHPDILTTIQRKQGYIKAHNKAGIPIFNELIRYGDSKHESGRSISEELLKLDKRPTAIFSGNNLITLGALETIHSIGLKIPDEIAIIGFDDMPWSISLNPPLTAVAQPGYEIGKRAVNLLLERIAEPEREPVQLTLKTKLMIRNSC